MTECTNNSQTLITVIHFTTFAWNNKAAKYLTIMGISLLKRLNSVCKLVAAGIDCVRTCTILPTHSLECPHIAATKVS